MRSLKLHIVIKSLQLMMLTPVWVTLVLFQGHRSKREVMFYHSERVKQMLIWKHVIGCQFTLAVVD